MRALALRERVQHRNWTAVEEAVTAAGLDSRVATATKDLAAAVAAGLLRPVGRARSRTYDAGETLYARIGATLGVPVNESGDPARGTTIGELKKRVASERLR